MSLLAAAGLGGLAGCAGGDGTETEDSDTAGDDTSTATPPPSDARGGHLQAGWFTGSIDTLDPPFITVGQYFQAAANIFNGLVTLAPDLTVRGDLATDWTVENGGKRFTFELREDVTFHNGSEFTAEDVRYTINRTIENETPAASKLSTLQPVDDGGVIVEDDYTVQLNFEQAMAPALIYLTRGPGRAATIVSKDAIEEMGADAYATEPVGTGPFQVTNHEVGSQLELEAYDDYFETDENGNQLPYLDAITIQYIPEPSSVVNALQSGDIHFSNLVPLQNVDQIESANGVEKLQAPGVNWSGLAMNQTREPFSDQSVRLGIAKSIDNQAFNETAYFGNAISARGPINKATNWAWRDDKPDDQAYAPDEGATMIEEAGASGASIDILTDQSSVRAAEAMKSQLDAAGFDTSIDQVTSSVYWERYENLEYDVTIAGSVGDPDPDQSLWNFYRKDGPWNWTGTDDDEIHQLLADQRRELDRDARRDILHELEDNLISLAPNVFLSHQDDIAAQRSEVNGFNHIPYLRNLHTVWIDN